MDTKTISEMTGLTLESLLSLLVTSSYQLTSAYGLSGDPDYLNSAKLLVEVRGNLLRYGVNTETRKDSKSFLFHDMGTIQ